MNWIKRLFKKKIKRELPLEYVHTFKTGEKIFTYRKSDWGLLSSRYYRGIQEATKNIQTYLAAPKKWRAFIQLGKDKCLEGMRDTTENGRHDALANLYNSFCFWEAQADLKTPEETMLELKYCLFFLLEDETERGYSEIHNDKKIQLLNEADPETRDFFLRTVKEITKDYLPTSEEDTLDLLISLKMVTKQWEEMQKDLIRSYTQGIGTN